MKIVNVYRLAIAFGIASTLSIALAGCGGGKGPSVAGSPITAQSNPVTPNGRSVNLNSYGACSLVSAADHLDPVKLQQALVLLSKCDTCVIPDMESSSRETPGWDGRSAASLKRLNPNTKVYIYYRVCKTPYDYDWGKQADSVPNPCNWECCMPWFEIEAHDWWLRDAEGNKITSSDGYYALDIGKPGFKEKLVEYIRTRSAGQPIDGFVLDGVDAAQSADWWATTHSRPPAYPTNDDWYEKAYKPYLNYVADELHRSGYKVVGLCQDYSYRNADPYHAFIRSKIDVSLYENWILNWDGTWKDPVAVEQRIQDFNEDPLESWVSCGGLFAGVSEYDRKSLAALAMYYVSIPQDQSKRSFHNYVTPLNWDPLWDLNIGTPVGERVKRPGKRFWSRTYTNGIVILNYEDSGSDTYQLSRSYKDAHGTVYSGTVTLVNHSALILTPS